MNIAIDSNNLTKIITIQKFCIEKLFLNELRKNIKIFTELNNHVNIHENHNLFNNNIENFDKLTELIIKKDIINSIKVFLNKFYRFIGFNAKSNNIISFQLNSRIFLSMYIIYGYPEIILSSKKEDIINKKVDQYDYDIYILSKNLFDRLNNLIENRNKTNLRKFVKSINMYSNCFLIWQNKDKLKKVRSLVTEWTSIQETIDTVSESSNYSDEQKEKTLTELKKSQENIFNMIKRFKININENYLKNFSNICKQIKTTYEKSYWDVLENELNKENYDFLKKILIEIQDNILKLRKNNNFKVDFKENYDVNFIIQMIENKAFSPENLLSYSNYLVDIIINLEAPIRNESTKNEWNKIIINFKASKLEEFNKNITIILKFILNRINDINNDIFNMYILNNL